MHGWLARCRAAWGAMCLLGLARRAEASEPAGFDSQLRGVIADVGIGTSSVGDYLLGELGGQWQGVQSLRSNRWLLHWDLRASARGGYLANQHPYLFLLGGRLAGSAEGGYRTQAERELSPYLGLRLASEEQFLAHPGRAYSDYDQYNSVDGVGGLRVGGALRFDAGASWLSHERSLLVVGFLEESFQDLQVYTEALLLTQLGVSARFDLRDELSASLEGAWGVSPERSDELRAFSDQTQRVSIAGQFRWVFQHQSWIAASLALARDHDHLQYAGGLGYDTASAPVFTADVTYGFSLERRAR
jgi:hypothetical protein